MNIYDAKTRLSQLIEKAAAGEDVVLSRNGKPVARITQLSTGSRGVKFGVLRGRIRIAHDFDAALPDDIIEAFEGR